MPNGNTLSAFSCPIAEHRSFIEKLLHWGNPFSSFLLLDNHGYHHRLHEVEWMAGIGQLHEVRAAAGDDALGCLSAFAQQHHGQWMFGHLAYDLKNDIEPGLSSGHPDLIGFHDLHWYVPQVVVKAAGDSLEILCYDPAFTPETIFADVQAQALPEPMNHAQIEALPVHSKESYLSIINRIREHIARGDCYELNFCLHHQATQVQADPIAMYQQLSAASPNPFSAYYKQGSSHLLCASPERFLLKKGNILWSQPIKGTAPRRAKHQDDFELERSNLQQSAKDRAENVMVVDLVRNDLSRICKEGTVVPEELFGIYSYPAVHQMISTVRGELRPEADMCQILKAMFPMGSMTGAPKRRVMELIETYEQARRGLFSGALGYISPEGDFDLNVVIRSILYNQASGNLHYAVGGGITWNSQPEKEWEECLLKAKAIRQVLGSFS